jgi:hypothetical protein
MADPKSGFRMKYIGGNPGSYDVIYNHNSIGAIARNPNVPDEWVFTADWNGQSWTADTLSQCKKIARQALKDMFKKHNLK